MSKPFSVSLHGLYSSSLFCSFLFFFFLFLSTFLHSSHGHPPPSLCYTLFSHSFLVFYLFTIFAHLLNPLLRPPIGFLICFPVEQRTAIDWNTPPAIYPLQVVPSGPTPSGKSDGSTLYLLRGLCGMYTHTYTRTLVHVHTHNVLLFCWKTRVFFLGFGS